MKGKAASAHLNRMLLAAALAAGLLAAPLLEGPSWAFATWDAAHPTLSQTSGRKTAPVKLPPSSGEPAATQPKKLSVGEQPDRRTRYSSTHYNADHTFSTTISGHPVNYHVRNAGWEPIDNTLVSSKEKGYTFQNRANSFQTFFKQTLDDNYVRFVVAGQPMTMSLEGASHAKAAVTGSSIEYKDALPHTSARYIVTATGVEELLTLGESSAPSSYRFMLTAPAYAEAIPADDGSWTIRIGDLASQSVQIMPPFAYEQGSRTINSGATHSHLEVKQVKSGFEITLNVDQSWLKDPSRHFPVIVDPTFTIQPDVMDATFDNKCSSCTGTTYGGRLYIGTDASHVYRSAVQFDLNAVPAGASITGASLALYNDWCLYNCASTTTWQLDAHRMTGAWSPSSTTKQIQFDNTVLSSVQVQPGASLQWLTWSVSGTVSNWLSGAQPNYGLYLQLSGDSKLGQGGEGAPGMSFPDPAVSPQLTVTYSGDAVTLNQPSALHANGAELSWSQYTGPSGAPFQQYQVHRSLTPHFTPSAATLLTSISDLLATGYRDTTAAPNGTFYYAVVANSSKSNEVKVTLPTDGQASLMLQPGPNDGKDTFISTNTTVSSCNNYGAGTDLAVGRWRTSFTATDVTRSLLGFDLHALPQTAVNITAQLKLLLQNSSYEMPSSGVTLHAYPVTASWEQGTGTNSCTGDGATWYERTGGVAWTSPGGDFDAGTSSSQVAVSYGAYDQWLSFDASNIVSKWVGGTKPNLGFLVKADDESSVTGLDFASADSTLVTGRRPLLQVTYTDGSHAALPTVSVSAPAPGSMVSGSSVTLSAAASSPGAVSKVQFFVDGSSVGSASQAPWQLTWNSASVGNGSHTITATATDSAGNTTTSAGLAVTVNNYPSPTTAIAGPANNASVRGTVSVTTANTVASGLTVSKVELYVDGALYATSTTSPWSFSWNTLDPNLPAFDGSHTLVSKVYDSSGLIVSSAPITVSVGNTSGTLYQAGWNPATAIVPQAMSYDPSAQSQLTYPVSVTVTNVSGQAWNSATTSLRYRWYLAGSTTSFNDSGDVASLGLAAGGFQTTQVNVSPPTMPDGMDAARFVLRFDLVDSSGSTPAFFADKGNPPLDNPVIVNKVLKANIGLEHFWQFTSQPVGAGISHMTNVANGNSLLTFTPWSEPGRGLSTVVRLIYNSLEEHSDSPAGNNWSLSISGLSRFGDPLDVHPNNADTIAGRSNKFINLVDGTGRLLTFTGVTNSDGTTSWFEPPGVHLFLRSVTTDTTNPRFWAITRPDRVTFFYNHDGFPTAVTDKNGNTLSFTLSAVQPGDDPGGPKFHVTQVTDAAGQGSNPAPNRSFNINYFTKATAKKPQIRGKIASISDHLGHQLSFSYYDDGNLLSITEQGGSNADGTPLASRSWIFTYTTSDGSGPAIPTASDRVNPDPKTPNESTKIFSVRDPNGNETLFTYNGPTSSIDRWKLASVQDRAGNLTSFSYDNVNQVTTVAEPTPSGQTPRTYKYAYDVQGRPTQITDPLGGTTSFQWSADNAVTKLTEPNNNTRQFTYNDNGYPTDVFDELGDHTLLTYQNIQADASDVSAHWNPNGGANGTGRTIPHLSQLQTKQDPKEVAAGSSNKWSFGYDGNGNLTSVTEPLFPNNPATTTYNADGTIANSKDFLGNQTTYLSYDANGLPTKIADATDSPTAPTHPLQIGYDAGGRTTFVQDENHAQFSGGMAANYQTQFFYDSFNRLGRQSTPKLTPPTLSSLGTLVWSDVSYDPNNNVLSSVAPHCVPKGDCFNETANDIATGDTTNISYDVLDRKTLVIDPSGNKTAYAYDAAGRLTQVTLPLGVQNGTPNNTHTVNYGYDALDRTTIQTQNHVNADNSVSALNTLACYDSVSNLVSVTAPKANLSSVSCPGTTSTPFTTVYAYDAAHRLTSTFNPLTNDGSNHQTQYVYDQNGNRITLIDANNNSTSYTYDALNRLTQTFQPFITGSSPHPVVSQTVYDADGNVVQSFSPRAVDCAQVSTCEPSGTNNYVTTNHYDQLNRLIRVDLPINTTDGIATDATQYYIHRAYDSNGNLLSISLPTTQSDPTQLKLTPGVLTQNVYFDPGWIASTQVGTNSLIRYDYNGKGQQTCRRPSAPCANASNEVHWSYQANGRLLSRSDQQGQPVNYVYDADGNLVHSHDASGITDPSQSPIDTQNSYDDLDRLVRSDLKKQSDTNWTFSSFAYDLNDNVSDQDQNGLEGNDPNSKLPNGVVVKDGHKLHSDYDQANWLTDQIDSTLNQEVFNTFTPIGLEHSREIDQITGPSSFNLKQKTSWEYFANGKLNTLTTTVPSQTPCATPCTNTQAIESHTVSYRDGNGVYVDGNRTQDQYSLRPGGSGSSPCFPGTCTAKYGYDPRDRLVQNDDGHGDVTNYTLDGAGNILNQVVQNGTTKTTTNNTYDPNNLTQLQKSVSGSQTLLYWYDALGRQQCVTDGGGNQGNCDPSENATFSPDLQQDYKYDYLDRLQTYRAFKGGNKTDEANYVYDALNRTVQETEQHPSFNGDHHVTQFSYLGLGGLETEEQQTSQNSTNTLDLKDFTYDVYGHRLAMTDTPYSNGQPGTPTTSTYGYDVHGSVSQLVDPNSKTTASYGYTPYGQSDSQLSQGENPDKTNPINPFRYSAKRLDTGSGTVDMGARRFGPDISHFLTPDFFYGSLANLSLSVDPLTDNRYDLAGGNPISFKEWDGHMVLADGGGGAAAAPTAPPPARGDACGGCLDPTMTRDTPTANQTQQLSTPATGAKPQPCGGNWFQQQICEKSKAVGQAWNAVTQAGFGTTTVDFVPHLIGFGYGATAEGGRGSQAAGATGSIDFYVPAPWERKSTYAATASAGAFQRSDVPSRFGPLQIGPSNGERASFPGASSNPDQVLGLFAGAGPHINITNAQASTDLGKTFTMYSGNVGFGVGSLGVQLSVGQNAQGQGIYNLAVAPRFLPLGTGVGISGASYNTFTWPLWSAPANGLRPIDVQ